MACLGFPSGPVVKNLPASAEAAGEAGLLSLWDDPPEKEWQSAPVFFLGSPGPEEPGGLQSMGSQKS